MKLGDSDLNALVHRNTMNNTPVSPPSPSTRTYTTSNFPKVGRLGLLRCTTVSDEATFKEVISSASLTYLRVYIYTIKTKMELQEEEGGASSTVGVFDIDGTTQLDIWLTQKSSGKVIL